MPVTVARMATLAATTRLVRAASRNASSASSLPYHDSVSPPIGKPIRAFDPKENSTTSTSGPTMKTRQSASTGQPCGIAALHARPPPRDQTSQLAPSTSRLAPSRPNDIAAPAGQLKRVENSSAMNWPSMLPAVPPISSGVT